METGQTAFDFEQLDVAEERKVYVKLPNGKFRRSKVHKGIWNLNKNHLSCIASDKYNIIQHKRVVKAIIEALRNLNIEFQHRLKGDGDRIFLDISFPSAKIYVDKGEEFIGGIRLVNSYNKTTGLLILPRLERLVCSNGMVVSKGFLKAYTIRHSQKLVEDFSNLIEKSINEMIDSSDKLKAMVNDCIADSVEWNLVEKIFQNLIYRKKHIEEIMKILEEKETVNKWNIYNSITQYATHGEQLKPNVEAWLQKKAEMLLTTPLKNYYEEKEISPLVAGDN